MTCTSPKQAFYPLSSSVSKKLIFDPESSLRGLPVIVPCRTCMSCKLLRAQGRAFLLYAETYSHTFSCCVTLTYANEFLPKDLSLTRGDDSDVSKFIRRLRDYYRYRDVDLNIKYFNAGEYGGKFGRPHHHVIIYGYDFPDKKLCRTRGKANYFCSDLLDTLWGNGIAEIGDVSTATCNYVAKYLLEKNYGASKVDFDTGVYNAKIPEFNTMSKGIGRNYFEKNKMVIYPADFVTMSGSDFRFRVPEYFDRLLSEDNPDLYDKVKQARLNRIEADSVSFTQQDLIAIDTNLRARLALYHKRSME